jgi:hypothetical protein
LAGSQRIASRAIRPASGASAITQNTLVLSAAASTGNRNSDAVELARISVWLKPTPTPRSDVG